MSTINYVHPNELIGKPWIQKGFNVVVEHAALVPPYDDENGWQVTLPKIKENQYNVVYIIVLQDLLTWKNGKWLEIEKIETHFAQHCNRVVLVHEEIDFFECYEGPCHTAWFPVFTYELLAKEIYSTSLEWQDYINKDATVPWQCLNGVPREHRKSVASWLQKHGRNGILSLGGNYPIKLPRDFYNSNYINKNRNNADNFLSLGWVYSKCSINIVTETTYFKRGATSEKMMFAFLSGQIPIAIGHKGFVQQNQSWGFDMFTDIVDTSYDTLDDNDRWLAALERNKDLINTGIDRTDYHDRLLKNKQLALDFHNYIADSYSQQIQQVIDKFV